MDLKPYRCPNCGTRNPELLEKKRYLGGTMNELYYEYLTLRCRRCHDDFGVQANHKIMGEKDLDELRKELENERSSRS